MPLERLQKILAAAGVASRRKSEELIASGQVSVNGKTVTEMGAKADPEVDRISVNGQILHGPERKVYLLMNKPKGYVTTVSDPEGRPTIMDLLPNIPARVFPVGRLDYTSEGLLLLTNDGELMQKLTHASSHFLKTYLVKVSGIPTREAIETLRSGIVLPPVKAHDIHGQPLKRKPSSESRPAKTSPAKIELIREGDNPWYEITIIEGRNRQLRRMFEQIGHRVEKIKRVKYGPLVLDVEPGKVRPLTREEVASLQGAKASRMRKPVRHQQERPSGKTRRSE
jgi:23S rRNA pseudouridine2605 synthase